MERRTNGALIALVQNEDTFPTDSHGSPKPRAAQIQGSRGRVLIIEAPGHALESSLSTDCSLMLTDRIASQQETLTWGARVAKSSGTRDGQAHPKNSSKSTVLRSAV